MSFYNTVRNSMKAAQSAYRSALSTLANPNKRVLIQPSGPGITDYNNEINFLHEQMAVYAGVNHLRRTPFTENQTGETREMRLKYRYALAEPAVKAALLGKITSVMSLSMQVNPVDRNSQRDRDVADLVKHAIKTSEKGLPGLIWEILSGGLIDGWSLSEKIWKLEQRGKWAGMRVLHNVKSKDSRYILPEVDRYLNVTAYWNMRGNAGHRFETHDFILFNYLSLFQNPTGMSDLRSSYRAIEMLPAVLRMRMIFLEKFKGPFLKGKITDTQLRNRMMNELYEARAKGYIVIDAGSDVEILDMATSGTSDFQDAINDLRQELAIGISGAFLHILTGANPNERGNTKIQQETTEGFVWILADMVANRIQRCIVPDIVDYNFGASVDHPEIKLEAVNPDDIIKELSIDEKLHSMGIDLSVDDILDRARRASPKRPEDTLRGAQQGFGGAGGFGFPGLGTISGGENSVSTGNDEFGSVTQ